jgi:hypothetical protein
MDGKKLYNSRNLRPGVAHYLGKDFVLHIRKSQIQKARGSKSQRDMHKYTRDMIEEALDSGRHKTPFSKSAGFAKYSSTK